MEAAVYLMSLGAGAGIPFQKLWQTPAEQGNSPRQHRRGWRPGLGRRYIATRAKHLACRGSEGPETEPYKSCANHVESIGWSRSDAMAVSAMQSLG